MGVAAFAAVGRATRRAALPRPYGAQLAAPVPRPATPPRQ